MAGDLSPEKGNQKNRSGVEMSKLMCWPIVLGIYGMNIQVETSTGKFITREVPGEIHPHPYGLHVKI